MIYEYRKYIATPGNLAKVHQRFEERVVGLFERHGIDVMAYFTPVAGASIMNEVHYIVRWPDTETMTQTWERFMSDPEVIDVVVEFDKSGPIVADAVNEIWKLTGYSPTP